MKQKNKATQIYKRIQGLLLAVIVMVTLVPAKPVEAASATTKKQFRQELLQMINTVDQSSHDVSRYKITGSELTSIFNKLKEADDSKWMVAAYYSNLCVQYSTSGKYVTTISLGNVDEDVAARYKRLENNVSNIKTGIEPKMTDLDKVMYLHDSIVELASYKYVAYQSYGAGGVLGDKIGVCAGYTKALNFLLADQGIKSVYMSSEAINHGWTAVYLDDQWYHIDSTWDDTRSPKSGLTSRKFFLKNDKEFVTGDKNSHVSWVPWNYSEAVTSTSTKYSDWYVHDIVGKMAFEDGFWYYVDTKTNCIMQNTAEGGAEKVMLNGNGKSTVTLVDATSAGISYKQDGTIKTIGYEGEKPEAQEEAPVVTDPTPKNEPVSTQPVAEVTGTKVYIYLQLTPGASYTQVGTGRIKGDKTSKNAAYVANDILSLPDLSEYVSDTQYIEWTAITKSGAGKMFLKGKVQDKAE
ncbi:MAG: hypothetical protein K5679_04170 [Lachnospiraceae bacterium]|nr:hypothetical protein [Lachnospiraceae bacterium]